MSDKLKKDLCYHNSDSPEYQDSSFSLIVAFTDAKYCSWVCL
uniref:Calcyphosine 2 n=1 Tax=Homo sapiens TaxID=9606 RepID=H7BXT1_HUMAN